MWGPIGCWDARLFTLGTEPGCCADRELSAEAFADGTVVLVDGSAGWTLDGAWRVAGPRRVVVCIWSGGATINVVVELSEDGHSFTGRTSIRGADTDDHSGSLLGMAEVTGRRYVI